MFSSSLFGVRGGAAIFRALVFVSALLALGGAGFASVYEGIYHPPGDMDDDSDDGFYKLTFTVPATNDGKERPGGWGALVLQFDTPAAGGFEGAKFKFMPACPTWQAGRFDDLASDFPKYQLGPGGYGLGKTGDTITSPPFTDTNPYLGQMFGTFDVVVEYEKIDGQAPPMVTSAFWQSKLTIGSGQNKVPNFTFRPREVDGEDVIFSGDMWATVPEPVYLDGRPSDWVLPERSGFITWLILMGACVGGWHCRRTWSTPQQVAGRS